MLTSLPEHVSLPFWITSRHGGAEFAGCLHVVDCPIGLDYFFSLVAFWMGYSFIFILVYLKLVPAYLVVS